MYYVVEVSWITFDGHYEIRDFLKLSVLTETNLILTLDERNHILLSQVTPWRDSFVFEKTSDSEWFLRSVHSEKPMFHLLITEIR